MRIEMAFTPSSHNFEGAYVRTWSAATTHLGEQQKVTNEKSAENSAL